MSGGCANVHVACMVALLRRAALMRRPFSSPSLGAVAIRPRGLGDLIFQMREVQPGGPPLPRHNPFGGGWDKVRSSTPRLSHTAVPLFETKPTAARFPKPRGRSSKCASMRP